MSGVDFSIDCKMARNEILVVLLCNNTFKHMDGKGVQHLYYVSNNTYHHLLKIT